MDTVSLSLLRNLSSFLLAAVLACPAWALGSTHPCSVFLKNQAPEFLQQVISGQHDLRFEDFKEELTEELSYFWLRILNASQRDDRILPAHWIPSFGPPSQAGLPYPTVKIYPALLAHLPPPVLTEDYLTEFFRFHAMATGRNIQLSSEVKIHLEDLSIKLMAAHFFTQQINFEIIFPPHSLPYLAILPEGPHPFNRLAFSLGQKSQNQILLTFMPHAFLNDLSNYAYKFYEPSQIFNLGSGILDPQIKNYVLLSELRLLNYRLWQQNYQQVPGNTQLLVRQGPLDGQGQIDLHNVERFIYSLKNLLQMALQRPSVNQEAYNLIISNLKSTKHFVHNVSAEIQRLLQHLEHRQRPKFGRAYATALPNLSQVVLSFPSEVSLVEYEFIIPFAPQHPLADDEFFLAMWSKQQLQLDHLYLTSTINQLQVLLNYLESGAMVDSERFKWGRLHFAQRYLTTFKIKSLEQFPTSQRQWFMRLHDIIEGP